MTVEPSHGSDGAEASSATPPVPYQPPAPTQGYPQNHPQQGYQPGYPQGYQQGYQQPGFQQPGYQQPGAHPPVYGTAPGGPPVLPKNPALGVILSFFVPGLGSMVNGSVGRGILILVCYGIAWLFTFVLIGIPFLIGTWIWGLADGYLSAQRWNRAHGIIS